jgi:hypothetical protein
VPFPGSTVTALISAVGALLGSAAGALLAYRASARAYRLEHIKLISLRTKSEEVERGRINAYRELWRCLSGISTFNNADEIVRNLPTVQKRLQDWYYDGGGGLFLTGAAEQSNSAKALFFSARDLQSTQPSEIWGVFHQLRRVIRRDLGVFESESDERLYVDSVKKKLGEYGT